MPDSEKRQFEGEMEPVTVKPVGIVRNKRNNTNWDPDFKALSWREKSARMKAQSQQVSEIIINPALENALDGIDEFSHIMVIFWAHRSPESARNVTRVHPLGSKDLPLVGVFSTHSPARPNNILVTVAELLSREGNVLKVTGLDALDGSPVLDIKPYIRYQEDIKNIRHPDWIKQIHSEFADNDVQDTGTADVKGS